MWQSLLLLEININFLTPQVKRVKIRITRPIFFGLICF